MSSLSLLGPANNYFVLLACMHEDLSHKNSSVLHILHIFCDPNIDVINDNVGMDTKQQRPIADRIT